MAYQAILGCIMAFIHFAVAPTSNCTCAEVVDMTSDWVEGLYACYKQIPSTTGDASSDRCRELSARETPSLPWFENQDQYEEYKTLMTGVNLFFAQNQPDNSIGSFFPTQLCIVTTSFPGNQMLDTVCSQLQNVICQVHLSSACGTMLAATTSTAATWPPTGTTAEVISTNVVPETPQLTFTATVLPAETTEFATPSIEVTTMVVSPTTTSTSTTEATTAGTQTAEGNTPGPITTTSARTTILLSTETTVALNLKTEIPTMARITTHIATTAESGMSTSEQSGTNTEQLMSTQISAITRLTTSTLGHGGQLTSIPSSTRNAPKSGSIDSTEQSETCSTNEADCLPAGQPSLTSRRGAVETVCGKYDNTVIHIGSKKREVLFAAAYYTGKITKDFDGTPLPPIDPIFLEAILDLMEPAVSLISEFAHMLDAYIVDQQPSNNFPSANRLCSNLEYQGPPPSKLTKTVRFLYETAKDVGCVYLIALVAACIAFQLLTRNYKTHEGLLIICQDLGFLSLHVLIAVYSTNDMMHLTRCQVVGFLLQYLNLTVFGFLLQTAIQAYNVLTSVITFGGYISRSKMLTLGWGLPLVVCAPTLYCLEGFASSNSCWTNFGHPLQYFCYGVYGLIALAATMIAEFSGISAREIRYERLPMASRQKRMSNHVNQSSVVVLAPVHIIAWYVTSVAIFEKSAYWAGIAFPLNIALGAAIWIFHVMEVPVAQKAVKLATSWIREKLRQIIRQARFRNEN